MAKPNKLRVKIGDLTAYQWLSEQLMEHGTITNVAEKNDISRAALYDLIERENLEVVQRVMKKVQLKS